MAVGSAWDRFKISVWGPVTATINQFLRAPWWQNTKTWVSHNRVKTFLLITVLLAAITFGTLVAVLGAAAVITPIVSVANWLFTTQSGLLTSACVGSVVLGCVFFVPGVFYHERFPLASLIGMGLGISLITLGLAGAVAIIALGAAQLLSLMAQGLQYLPKAFEWMMNTQAGMITGVSIVGGLGALLLGVGIEQLINRLKSKPHESQKIESKEKVKDKGTETEHTSTPNSGSKPGHRRNFSNSRAESGVLQQQLVVGGERETTDNKTLSSVAVVKDSLEEQAKPAPKLSKVQEAKQKEWLEKSTKIQARAAVTVKNLQRVLEKLKKIQKQIVGPNSILQQKSKIQWPTDKVSMVVALNKKAASAKVSLDQRYNEMQQKLGGNFTEIGPESYKKRMQEQIAYLQDNEPLESLAKDLNTINNYLKASLEENARPLLISVAQQIQNKTSEFKNVELKKAGTGRTKTVKSIEEKCNIVLKAADKLTTCSKSSGNIRPKKKKGETWQLDKAIAACLAAANKLVELEKIVIENYQAPALQPAPVAVQSDSSAVGDKKKQARLSFTASPKSAQTPTTPAGASTKRKPKGSLFGSAQRFITTGSPRKLTNEEKAEKKAAKKEKKKQQRTDQEIRDLNKKRRIYAKKGGGASPEITADDVRATEERPKKKYYNQLHSQPGKLIGAPLAPGGVSAQRDGQDHSLTSQPT